MNISDKIRYDFIEHSREGLFGDQFVMLGGTRPHIEACSFTFIPCINKLWTGRNSRFYLSFLPKIRISLLCSFFTNLSPSLCKAWTLVEPFCSDSNFS